MAPVEPDSTSAYPWPLVLFGADVALIVALLLQAVSRLRRAAASLPPSQQTRRHVETRSKAIGTFAALTAASMLVLSYHALARYMCSLADYAKMVGTEWPDRPLYQVLPHAERWPSWRDVSVLLGRWWRDVDLEKQYEDVASGTARGLWWTGQLGMARVAWSAFLGIEGHRRCMSAWLILPLVALSRVCALSVAQNLSFIALLLSPVPIRGARSTLRRHSSLWTPHPAVYIIPIVIATGCLFSMHTFVSSPHWSRGLGYLVLDCQVWLGVAAKFIPLSWGTMGENGYAMHRRYTGLYRMIGGFSLAHFLYRTLVALYVNSPSRHGTRHSFVWNMEQGYERSAMEMVVFAGGRVLNAISHEPAISSAGWDVLLSGFGLCVWAAVRRLDASEMVRSIVPLMGSSKEDQEPFKPTMLGRRGRGRPRKTTAAGRSSGRRRPVAHGSDSEDYVPSAAVAAEVASMEHEEKHGKEDVVEELESVALTWGLAVVGGLGLASAAVMGAELRIR